MACKGVHCDRCKYDDKVTGQCQTTADGHHVMYPLQQVREGGTLVVVVVVAVVVVVECSGVCNSAVVGGCGGEGSFACSGGHPCHDGGASVRGVDAVKGVAENGGAPSCSR